MRVSKHKNPAQSLVNKRRIRALARLEEQLNTTCTKTINTAKAIELGYNPEVANTSSIIVVISATDRKRIEKEITTLKARIR